MSIRTTFLGPRVSFSTSLADAGPVHVYGDSSSTFEWDGTFLIDGGVTLNGDADLNNLSVDSAMTAAGTVVFTGAIDSQSTTTLSGVVDIDGMVNSSSTVTFSGAHGITGALTAAGVNVFSGAVDSQSTTTLSGVVDIDGALNSSSTATFSGTFDQTALTSVFLSKQTTASYTSLTLSDGEFSVGSVSVGSATIYFRSGVTTYEFVADAATVL